MAFAAVHLPEHVEIEAFHALPPHVLLGSVAERVARYADRPVLVLPPPARLAAAQQRTERESV